MTHRSEEVLQVRHLVNASREATFDAWTTPEVVEDWWGPHGYRTKVEWLDARQGGRFVFQMTGPSGASCPMTGTYVKVERPHLLAFDVEHHCIADMPDHIRAPSRTSHVEVRFMARGNATEVILLQRGLLSDYRMLAEAGWSQCFARIRLMPGPPARRTA